jgi:hypothetical protein
VEVAEVEEVAELLAEEEVEEEVRSRGPVDSAPGASRLSRRYLYLYLPLSASI